MRLCLQLHCRFAIFCCVGLAWFGWLGCIDSVRGCQSASDESSVVDRYLERLALDEMRLEYLLQQISGAADAESRQRWLRRFGECLTAAAPEINQQNCQDWRRYLESAEEFSLRYPESTWPELRHHILRLRFTWAEQQFFDRWRWQSDAQSVARWPLELMRLATDVRDARAALNRSRDPMVGTESTLLPTAAAGNAVAQQQIAQLIYWEAWLHFFRAVTIDAERESQALDAVAAFRELLDLPSGQTLRELPRDWLDLRSEPWQFRAVLGMALASRQLGRDEDADWCFEQLAVVDGFGQSPLSATYWNLCSYLWAGRIAPAIQFLNLNLDQQRSSSERLTWWLACLHEAQLKTQNDSAQIQRLLSVGLMGLIRDGHESLLANEWQGLAGFATTMADELIWKWAAAVVASRQAEKSGALEAWQQADAMFRAIDAQSRDQLSRDDQALLCVHWARALYQTQQWTASAEQAGKAYAHFLVTQPDRAAALGWLIAQCRLAIAAQQPLAITEARQALLRLQQDCPDSPYARKAELELLRLDQSLSTTEDRYSQLDAWQPDHPAYPEALLLRVAETHRRALAHIEIPMENRNAAWEDQFNLLDRRLDGLQREVLTQRQQLSALQALKLEVYFLDIAERWTDSLASGSFAAPRSWWNQMGQWESATERLATLRRELPPQSPAVSESRYYEWLLAERMSDEVAIREHSQWLLENAQQTEFYGAALSHRANQDYERWKTQPDNSPWQREALESHQTLREWLLAHRTPQNNLRLSTIERRMADWLERLEQWAQADLIYEALRAQSPDEAPLLVRAVRVKMKLQQWPEALQLWRRLVGGTVPGTPEWLEAKWGVIRCLQVVDPVQARAVWQQTLDLHPEMPEPWRSQFRDWKWD